MDEIWKDVVGYEGMYQVSSNGRVRSLDRLIPNKSETGRSKRKGRMMFPYSDKLGYMFVKLSKNGISKRYLVHVLVMSALVGPCPEGMERNHLDGDKGNNTISNLEYCTRSENIKHMYQSIGIVPVWGENHWKALLTEKSTKAVLSLYATGKYKQRELAERFKVRIHVIQRLVSGASWKRLNSSIPRTSRSTRKYHRRSP